MNRKAVAVLAGGCLIAGVVMIALYGAAIAKASAGDDWTQKIGTIEKESPLTYRYDVDGRTHRSTRVTFDPAANDERAKALGYSAGRRVLVYVNPADPADAVLELGRRPTNWMPPVAGGVLIVVGVALGVYLVLPQREQAAPARTTQPGETTQSRRSGAHVRNGDTTGSRRSGPNARVGDTTSGGSSSSLSRLKPPPTVKRKAPEDESPS
jgi:hypothetical protein